MKLKVHQSAERIKRHRQRLTTLRDRIREQINDADFLLATLDDYCRENPSDKPCAGNDPGWRRQIVSQKEQLEAMLSAVNEKLKSSNARQR
jgi:hypothetical protein